MLICGIDEAGRGPVVGSLFIAGAVFEEAQIAELQEEGIKDSKLLTQKRREHLCKVIEKRSIKWKIIKVEPKEIDDAVDGNTYLNLNWLEALKTAEIINELRPDMAVVDCPSPNIEKYTDFLRRFIKNKEIRLIVEHKADVKYFPCSAASIIAKCARENHVKEIEKEIGESIGSGYMSNPICVEFLKNNWEKHSDLFRHSWQPFKDHKDGKKQKSLGEF